MKRSSGTTVRRARKATKRARPAAKTAARTAAKTASKTARTVATGMKVASAVLDEGANFVDSMAGGRSTSRKRR